MHIVTSTPNPLKIDANSTAIYPPPRIKIFFGSFFRSKASSDVMIFFCALNDNFLGFVPTAIKNNLDCIKFLPTLTVY